MAQAYVRDGPPFWCSGVNGEVLVETTLNKGLRGEYIYFAGQRACPERSRRVARRKNSGAVWYYFSDHLGSTRLQTDATGGVVQDIDYYPFGGERVVTELLGNGYKFTRSTRPPRWARSPRTGSGQAGQAGALREGETLRLRSGQGGNDHFWFRVNGNLKIPRSGA